jgi:hypothetical protein
MVAKHPPNDNILGAQSIRQGKTVASKHPSEDINPSNQRDN